MALAAATKSFMLLGQCVPCIKQSASKFKIKRLELDENLLMVRHGLLHTIYLLPIYVL